MNEEMLELIRNIEGLGTVGVVLSVIAGIIAVICFFYTMIKQWIDLSDMRSYFDKVEEFGNVLAKSGDTQSEEVVNKREELDTEIDDLRDGYSRRSNVHIVLVTLFFIVAIGIFGVYSARAYKLDQLNDKLSRIQVCTLEEQGLVANGEYNAKIEKNKVKVNMIVRVINVSGEKLLNAQIKDNISGAKIQVDSMEANKEKTYEILQNVNNSTKLDLELLEYEFQE